MAELDFTMGADPEFLCIDGRSIVMAEDFTDLESEIGRDGNRVLFEVRPKPSTDPLVIVGNMHDIFTRWVHSHKEFQKFQWRAGSHYADMCMGGHIHFGIKPSAIPIADCASVLDNYVGAITMLIENRNQGLRRRQDNHNYGRMSDTRPQKWGFEYRTPASWVSSPYVSAAVLCLSKVVMYEFANNNNFTPRTVVSAEDFTTMNTKKILQQFPQLWRDITEMQLYQQYKPYVDLIYFLVKKGLTWFPSTSMKEAWGLVDVSKTYVDKIKMDVLWERFHQEIDENGYALTQPIIHRPHQPRRIANYDV